MSELCPRLARSDHDVFRGRRGDAQTADGRPARWCSLDGAARSWRSAGGRPASVARTIGRRWRGCDRPAPTKRSSRSSRGPSPRCLWPDSEPSNQAGRHRVRELDEGASSSPADSMSISARRFLAHHDVDAGIALAEGSQQRGQPDRPAPASSRAVPRDRVKAAELPKIHGMATLARRCEHLRRERHVDQRRPVGGHAGLHAAISSSASDDRAGNPNDRANAAKSGLRGRPDRRPG